jgi:2-methylisocitrate lyase-like PEP mutase family enzyme
MRTTTRLRRAVADGGIVAPGCYDPFSARLAELAGFEAVHLSGFAVEATQLGVPDLGVVTLTELCSVAGRITDTIDIPVFADIDTGFGGVLNVTRTIRQMEKAGVAGVHIEDQQLPKHCPVLKGARTLASRVDAVDRVKCALDARDDDDFLIVARTDGDVVSAAELVDRCNLYLEAGADLVMPMDLELTEGGMPFHALPPHERMRLSAQLVSQIDGPVVWSGALIPEGYTATDLFDIGFRLLPVPTVGLSAAANALSAAYAALRSSGSDHGYRAAHPGEYNDPLSIFDAVRIDEYLDIEKTFTH